MESSGLRLSTASGMWFLTVSTTVQGIRRTITPLPSPAPANVRHGGNMHTYTESNNAMTRIAFRIATHNSVTLPLMRMRWRRSTSDFSLLAKQATNFLIMQRVKNQVPCRLKNTLPGKIRAANMIQEFDSWLF